MTDTSPLFTPFVERRRGPYEIAVAQPSRGAIAEVTLSPESSKKRAIARASAYLASCEPDAIVTVHRVTATGDVLEYRALLEADRTIVPI